MELHLNKNEQQQEEDLKGGFITIGYEQFSQIASLAQYFLEVHNIEVDYEDFNDWYKKYKNRGLH